LYSNEIQLINFDDVFCHGDKCLLGNVNQSYYMDSNHMSLVGSKLLNDRVVAAFKDKQDVHLTMNQPNK
jgi:hypothetical protein